MSLMRKHVPVSQNLIFDNDFELDVRADSENETVWLTQEEMAKLLNVDRTRIVRHISSIYKDNELEKVQHVRKAHKFKSRAEEPSNVSLSYVT